MSVSAREDIQRELGARKRGRSVMAKCLSMASLAILISSALLVFPMSSAPVDAAPVVMTVGTTLVPDTFNPFSMMSGTSWTATHFIYERLVTDDPVNRQPIPMLAESWETSPDGKVWTFHLVQNSIWHDDVPVTAEDVNFTFNLIINNPREGGLYTNYVTNITDVRALDDYTVRFTTDVPKATMLSMWVPILPKHLWSLVPINRLQGVDMWSNVYFPNGPIGSGPMVLDSYDRTLGEIRFLKWDKYHMGTINVDEVLFKVFSSEDPMMTALGAGSIDLAMYVPNNLWDTTLASDDIDGQVADAFVLNELGFNCASPTMKFATDTHGRPLFPKASQQTETWNMSVRQAVAMAINKTQLVTEIMKDLADKGDTLIPPITPFWKYNVTGAEEWKFDPEGAKAKLETAGYRDVDSDGIRENVSNPTSELSFNFFYITGVAADELAAGKIADWLLAIGISVQPDPIVEMTMYQKVVNMEADMYLWNWWPDVDPSFILSVMTTDEIPADNGDMSAWQDPMYSNPVYDQMFLEQLTAVDLTERQTIVHEMQKILYHDCPYVILWYPYSLFAYRTDRFTNFPNFEAEPGTTPDNFWFYFQVKPSGGNQVPVFEAGLNPNYSPVVNTLQTFSVQVSDSDNDRLWVNWTFGDGSAVAHDIVPAGSSLTPVTLTQSHTYIVLSPDTGYTMTVTLTDGISGHERVSTSTVFVIERPDDAPKFTSQVESSPTTQSSVYNDEVVTWYVNASDHESGGAAGFGLRFTWDWDDGTFTVSNHQPTVNDVPMMDTVTHSWPYVGTYNVVVWVWDGNPNVATHNVSGGIIPVEVVANSPPYAPNLPTISGTEGTWIECVASSVDADSDGLRFTWEWDDGTFNVTNQAPSADQVTSTVFHRWPVTGAPATHPVTVYVDDRTGYTGHNLSTTIDASISVVGENVAPTALLIIPPPRPWYLNTDLKFNTSAIDTDGDALEFFLEFGDGTSSVTTLPAGAITRRYVDFTHTYTTVGPYTPTLWVNDSTGPANHNSTTYTSIRVVANQVPWVQLPSPLTAGYNRTFTATPTVCRDNDSDPLQVWYDWGDGTPMTQGGAISASYAGTHIYSSLGNKTLTIYANDGTGLTGHNASATETVKVSEANLKPEIVGVIERTPSRSTYSLSETITFTIVVKDFEGDNMTLTVEFGDGASQVVAIPGATVEAANAANTNITKTVTHAYAAARTSPYSVNATIEDDMDHSDENWSVGTTSVQVTAPAPPPSEGFPLALAAGIAIAAVIAVAAILLLLRRRNKGEASTMDAAPPAEPS